MLLAEVSLISGIGLILAGIMILRISWRSLTFQENDENAYDLRDLALYGGKFGTFKNLCRGLAGIITGKHQALRSPSFSFVLGIVVSLGGFALTTLSQS